MIRLPFNDRLRQLAKPVVMPLLALVFALLLGAVLMGLGGYSAGAAYGALFQASFGSLGSFTDTLVKASPLLFTGMAVAFAFKANVFNIGAEGQFLAGGMMVAWLGPLVGNLPKVVALPLLLIVAAAGGALFGLLPAYLKVSRGISEVITTIMLNYIGLNLLGYVVHGPLKDVSGGIPQTAAIAESARLPMVIPGQWLHLGYVIGVILALLLGVVLSRSYFGFEVRAVGLNPTAARAYGIRVPRTVFLVMCISGGLAGLGGGVEMSGVAYRLFEGFSPGYGYTAIAVALMAANSPVGVIFTSILFGALSSGSMMMQQTAGVSSVFVSVFQSLIVLFVACAVQFQGNGLGLRFLRSRRGVV
ncbi:MAG TPA: ABC transporter permease [Bacillota bacterium]